MVRGATPSTCLRLFYAFSETHRHSPPPTLLENEIGLPVGEAIGVPNWVGDASAGTGMGLGSGGRAGEGGVRFGGGAEYGGAEVGDEFGALEDALLVAAVPPRVVGDVAVWSEQIQERVGGGGRRCRGERGDEILRPGCGIGGGEIARRDAVEIVPPVLFFENVHRAFIRRGEGKVFDRDPCARRLAEARVCKNEERDAVMEIGRIHIDIASGKGLAADDLDGATIRASGVGFLGEQETDFGFEDSAASAEGHFACVVDHHVLLNVLAAGCRIGVERVEDFFRKGDVESLVVTETDVIVVSSLLLCER